MGFTQIWHKKLSLGAIVILRKGIGVGGWQARIYLFIREKKNGNSSDSFEDLGKVRQFALCAALNFYTILSICF